MAADPLQPETVTSILRDFERRLRNLETAPRAVATSVSAGAFSINDADGNELVRLGLLDDGGNYGIQVTNDQGGRVFRVTQNGMREPSWPLAITPAPTAPVGNGSTMRAGTTSATYTELWRADFYCTGYGISFDFYEFPNGGNMDWRAMVYEVGGGSPAELFTRTGVTANAQYAAGLSIPTDGLAIPGSDPIGKSLTMRIEARRNSGSNSVDIGVNASPLVFT